MSAGRVTESLGVEPFALPVTPACSDMIDHWALILWYGECGCWKQGRNRSAYWGWSGRPAPFEANRR